mgnify:CR=1 FL=1
MSAEINWNEWNVYCISIMEFKLNRNQGMIAEVKLTLNKGDLSKNNHIVILDSISDPGNLGTLIRTAQALGFNSIFITKESADPFSSKALRAAKGATFNIPLQIGDISELLNISVNSLLIFNLTPH